MMEAWNLGDDSSSSYEVDEENRLLNTVLPVLTLLHSDIYSSNDRRQRPAA